MTFSSPSWRSLNPLKGLPNHPKKVTKNGQVFSFKNQAMEVVLPGGALIFNIGIRHALVGVSEGYDIV